MFSEQRLTTFNNNGNNDNNNYNIIKTKIFSKNHKNSEPSAMTTQQKDVVECKIASSSRKKKKVSHECIALH